MNEIDDLQAVCEFGPERVYLLVAIARAKENDAVSAGSVPVSRKIVDSPAELADGIAELDHAVRRFDHRFRLYLTVNARNTTKAFFRLRENMDDWLEMRFNGNEDVVKKFKRIDSEFESVLQSDRCRDDSYFLFDLDDVTGAAATDFQSQLSGVTNITMVRSTPNGFHVVTEPFDYTAFESDVDYELKTDGLLFLTMLGEGASETATDSPEST